MSYPQMVCILTSDVLLVRLDRTHFGFIRLRPGPASSPLDMTPEPCTLEFADTHRAYFHSEYSTGSTFHIDLKTGTRIIAISITRDLSSMSLDSSWDTSPPPRRVDPSQSPPHSFLCGPQRVGYVMFGDDGMRIQITARPSIAPEAAQRRLGTRMGKDFAMNMGRAIELNDEGLMFDDWTGIALVSHTQTRDFYDCATVITL
jgi:hypothetical protein